MRCQFSLIFFLLPSMRTQPYLHLKRWTFNIVGILKCESDKWDRRSMDITSYSVRTREIWPKYLEEEGTREKREGVEVAAAAGAWRAGWFFVFFFLWTTQYVIMTHKETVNYCLTPGEVTLSSSSQAGVLNPSIICHPFQFDSDFALSLSLSTESCIQLNISLRHGKVFQHEILSFVWLTRLNFNANQSHSERKTRDIQKRVASSFDIRREWRKKKTRSSIL